MLLLISEAIASVISGIYRPQNKVGNQVGSNKALFFRVQVVHLLIEARNEIGTNYHSMTCKALELYYTIYGHTIVYIIYEEPKLNA